MGTQLPSKAAQPPIFGPCPLWPNCWMYQDATWYRVVDLGPGHIVLDGDLAPHSRKRHSRPPLFGPCLPNGRPFQLLLRSFLTFLVTSKRLQCTTQYTRVLSQPQRQVVTDVCLCSKQLTWFYTTTSTTVAAQSTNINNNSLHSVHCRSVRQAVCTAPRPLSMQTSTDFFLPYDVRQYAI